MTMFPASKPGLYLLLFWIVTALAWLGPLEARAARFQVVPDELTLDLQQPRKLHLVFGKAVILRSSTEVDRALVADPEVVSVRPVSAREIYLRPIAAGNTNLILWQNQDVAAVYDVEVVYDLSRLKQRLYDLFPGELDLRVMSDPAMDSITLAGRVSSTANLDQILSMAEAFAPRDKIRNLVQVGGVHQVMLEVKVAEVVVDAMKQMGVDFNLIHKTGEFALGFLSNTAPALIGPPGAIYWPPSQFSLPPDISLPLAGNVPMGNLAMRASPGRDWQWQGIFNVLKENGLAKILAEPSLIAMSGQTASFVAGGEIPIPVLDREGNVGIEYQPYGIQLAFTPTVLDASRIAIEVQPSVSELDYNNAITVFGSRIPAKIVRQASTSVELGDGQGFAIAGLLSEFSREGVSMFPGLGNLPVLGALFSSKNYQSLETELVILITPRLVKPLVTAEQPLPTDFYIPPNDAEFYLLGIFGNSHMQVPRARSAEFDGQFGHVVVP